MKLIYNLILALPEIIELLKALQKRIDKADKDRRVADDIKTIHEAFSEKDPAKLNSLFNS